MVALRYAKLIFQMVCDAELVALAWMPWRAVGRDLPPPAQRACRGEGAARTHG